MRFFFLFVLAYLMGSLCSAIIVSRLFNLPDPRKEGSQNPGATNVLRLSGKRYAALVFLFDVLKGTIPVLLAKILSASDQIIGFTALAAVIGHMYPVFFKFKGGKGVATAIGTYFGIQLLVGVMVCATWLLVAKLTRHASAASLVAVIFAPFFILIGGGSAALVQAFFIMILLIVYQHRANISRIFDGTEPKITLKYNLLREAMGSDKTNNETSTEKNPKKKI